MPKFNKKKKKVLFSLTNIPVWHKHSRHHQHENIVSLTVLGLVRFRASVSQLLRWLYVLLLRDITQTHRSCVFMTVFQKIFLRFPQSNMQTFGVKCIRCNYGKILPREILF